MEMELNLKNESGHDLQLNQMQQQIDALNQSMGKVRRRLFAEISDLKNICQILKIENEELKSRLRREKNEKLEWVYGDGESLFTLKEYQASVG